jgi:type II secretory pathway component PulJ
MAKPTYQPGQTGPTFLGAMIAIAVGAVLGIIAAQLFPL